MAASDRLGRPAAGGWSRERHGGLSEPLSSGVSVLRSGCTRPAFVGWFAAGGSSGKTSAAQYMSFSRAHSSACFRALEGSTT